MSSQGEAGRPPRQTPGSRTLLRTHPHRRRPTLFSTPTPCPFHINTVACGEGGRKDEGGKISISLLEYQRPPPVYSDQDSNARHHREVCALTIPIPQVGKLRHTEAKRLSKVTEVLSHELGVNPGIWHRSLCPHSTVSTCSPVPCDRTEPFLSNAAPSGHRLLTQRSVPIPWLQVGVGTFLGTARAGQA